MSLRPHEQVPVDPDVGIPDLIRRLTDDSKRLAADEVRLAKLEMRESVHVGSQGVLRLALAFGIGVVTLAATTVFLAAVLGLLFGNYWAGAAVTGIVELAIGAWMIRSGMRAFSGTEYTFPESREALKDTQAWVAAPRAD